MGEDAARADYRAFDLLRFMAATSVVVSHVRDLLLINYSGGGPLYKSFYLVTGLGHQSVMLFFVISGFWIAKTVDRRVKDGSWAWSTYLLDRLSRLWVALLPALLLGAALDGLGRYILHLPMYKGVLGNTIIVNDVSATLTPIIALGNALFIQGILVPTLGTNGPLWSLANEFWYYIWFAAAFSALRRRPNIFAIIIAAITALTFRSLWPGFACWLCGAAVYFLRPDTRRYRTARWLVLPAGALLIACLLLPKVKPAAIPRSESDFLIAMSTSLFLAVWMSGRARLWAWLSPLAAYGARSSYSVYVAHLPIAALFIGLYLGLQKQAFSSSTVLIIAGFTLGLLLAGYVFSLATERHTPAVRRWLAASIGMKAASRLGEPADYVREAGSASP